MRRSTLTNSLVLGALATGILATPAMAATAHLSSAAPVAHVAAAPAYDEDTKPIAGNDTFTTKKNTPVHINLTANDKVLAPGATLHRVHLLIAPLNTKAPWAVNLVNGQVVDGVRNVSSITIPGKGTLTQDSTGATFTPAKNYVGPVPSFVYQIEDSEDNYAAATVTGVVTK